MTWCAVNSGGTEESKRSIVPQGGAAGIGQSAHEPIRLQRIGEPRLRPTLFDATPDSAIANALTPLVKQWQLAARLVETAGQPLTLLRRRPVKPAAPAKFDDECFL
jgi:hypothetical protein